MYTNEMTLAKARQEHLRAEAAQRRLGATWQGTTGRSGLIQVWSTVRATLTATPASPSITR